MLDSASNDDESLPPKPGTPEAKSLEIYSGYAETCWQHPWSRNEHPTVAAWLEQNKGALETLALAVEKDAILHSVCRLL